MSGTVERGQVVIITGSREWIDDVAIERRLRRYPKGTLLLHGAAIGADAIAARIGLRRGFHVLPIAYFSDLGKMGGHERNAFLVAIGALFNRWKFRVTVEAFPMPSSRGTWDCVEQAREAGLETFTTDRN